MTTIVRNVQTLDNEIEILERQLAEKRRQLKASSKPRACDEDAIDKAVVQHGQSEQRHRALRKNFLPYLNDYGYLVVLTAPVIYSTFIALVILDVFLTFYQWCCFPVYGLERVRRRDYILVDRHQLAYLNIVEKLNCAFCGYANGLLAYGSEIASRTEEFWCPIKHAAVTRGLHARTDAFAEHTDAAEYRIKQRKNGAQARQAACNILKCSACKK